MCGVNMGGLLGLKADFEIVDKLLETGERTGENVCSQGTRESFQLIVRPYKFRGEASSTDKGHFNFKCAGACRV